MLDKQSGDCHSMTEVYGSKSGQNAIWGNSKESLEYLPLGKTTGGASRFFYCAKASRSERGNGNSHPTVKPVKLIEYLVRMVSRESAIILDPFLGSGTTAICAKNLNRKYIGIDSGELYCGIAVSRLT
jgi:site-specific DNA-methyltransferase (adenine-specific)